MIFWLCLVITGSCIFIVVFFVMPQMEDAAVLSACLYIP